MSRNLGQSSNHENLYKKKLAQRQSHENRRWHGNWQDLLLNRHKVFNLDVATLKKVNPNDNCKCLVYCLPDFIRTYLQPHYGNGVFDNVYISAGQH